MMFVRAYPRETQEMVFDAHDRAFAFFKGACTRGIYDNMKTAVEAIFVGRERAYNRRFLQMCSHYLVEPQACTPASGWEKGQVDTRQPGQDGGSVVVGGHGASGSVRIGLDNRILHQINGLRSFPPTLVHYCG